MVSNALEWMTSGKGSGLGRYMAGAQADIPIAADTVAAKWVPASGLALTGGIPAAEALRNEQGISPVQLVPEYPGCTLLNSKMKRVRSLGSGWP